MSVKTFFEKVGGELEKLFKSSTTQNTIQATVTYVAPLVEGILTIVDPAIEPLVAGAINTIKADLATISTVAQGTKVAPGTPAMSTVQTAINSVTTNLSSILKMAEVKNSNKVSEITGVVTLVNGEMNAMMEALTPPAVSAPAAS